MELRDIVANNLVELRKIYAFTQVEIAEKLNYSDKAISKWERGESLPDIETLKKLADIYGVTVDYLLNDNTGSKKKPARKGLIIGQKMLIAMLSVLLVWIVATATFAVLCWCGIPAAEATYSFIVALPVSFIVLIVFDSLWGKVWLNLIFISGLLWTLALCVFLAISSELNWLCFIIPIPLQIAALLWLGLKLVNQSIVKKKS